MQEENAAYEKAISDCQSKIQEKLKEADVLRISLQVKDKIPKSISSILLSYPSVGKITLLCQHVLVYFLGISIIEKLLDHVLANI